MLISFCFLSWKHRCCSLDKMVEVSLVLISLHLTLEKSPHAPTMGLADTKPRLVFRGLAAWKDRKGTKIPCNTWWRTLLLLSFSDGFSEIMGKGSALWALILVCQRHQPEFPVAVSALPPHAIAHPIGRGHFRVLRFASPALATWRTPCSPDGPFGRAATPKTRKSPC